MTGRWIAAAVLIAGIYLMSKKSNNGFPSPPLEWFDAFKQATDANGLPSGLLARMAWQESNYNPNAVNKRSGATGLLQFMPGTWAEWGRGDILDPLAQIDAAGRYMTWLYRQTGNWADALAAYNWGIGNLTRKGRIAAPTETRNYQAQIAADVHGVEPWA